MVEMEVKIPLTLSLLLDFELCFCVFLRDWQCSYRPLAAWPSGSCVTRLARVVWPWQMAATHRSNVMVHASVIYLVLGRKIRWALFPCKNVQITVKLCFYGPCVWL